MSDTSQGPDTPQVTEGITGTLVRILSYAGAIGIFSLMALVFVSVFFRYVLNDPILAVEDIMAMLLGVTIFTAVPSVTLARRHISVDLLTKPFEFFPLADRIRRIVIDLGVVVMSFYVSYLINIQAMRYMKRETLSLTMEWPLHPITFLFSGLVLAGGILFALRTLKDKGEYEEKGGLDL